MNVDTFEVERFAENKMKTKEVEVKKLHSRRLRRLLDNFQVK